MFDLGGARKGSHRWFLFGGFYQFLSRYLMC